MARTREKIKGRRTSGAFVPLPCSVLDHPNFINLSAKGTRLLIDLCSQLRFKEGGPVNNGDLAATPALLKDRGWNSNESIDYAIRELTHYGFIELTRRGDRRRCHLFAVTWWGINDCGGKLDVKETPAPLNTWRDVKPKWKRPERKSKSVPRFPKNKPRIAVDNAARGKQIADE
jgi:hypothetical protein